MSLDPAFLERIRAHAALYRSDPEAGHDFVFGKEQTIYPACLLITSGRRSHRPIETPLIYAREDDRVILVASLGGAPSNPAWYGNLVANPDATIQIKHDKWSVRARTAEGMERQRLWKIAANIFPPYDEYQSRTERQIPVIVLERA